MPPDGTHPLAAIGAYLSFKNSVDFFKYCALVHNLKTVPDDVLEASRRAQLEQKALDWVEAKMIADRMMVFLQARLCSHYSR